MLTTLFETRAAENPRIPLSDPRVLSEIFGESPTTAGITVNENTAFNFSAIYAAVRCIAETVASLPLIVYERRSDGGKDRAARHNLFRVLHDTPNPEMTSMVFREVLTANLLTWGNGYAQIVRDNSGVVRELWPILPWQVEVKRSRAGELIYQINGERTETLRASEVLHIPGLSFDGLEGKSVIRLASETIAMGLAAERFGARFFGNSARPSVVIKMPPGKTLSDRAHNDLVNNWQRFSGSGSFRPAVLDNGAEVQFVTIPPEDAQFLESRKFQITEVARWFRLPPHKLGDLERATFTNIEQQNIDFIVDSIRPWLTRWEQELNRKLFSTRQHFAEHLVVDFLRGDSAARSAFYRELFGIGVLSINEIRAAENLNPITDGDEHFVPLNMAPISMATEPPAAPEPEQPPSEPEAEPDETPTEQDDEPGDTEANAARQLLSEVIRRLKTKESNAIKRAAKSPRDFVDKVDEFYQRHNETLNDALTPVIDAVRAFGFNPQPPRQLAKAINATSKDAVLTVAGRAFPATLAHDIEALAASWNEAWIENVTHQILGV